ncbi:hypothetical protein WISP_71750 [Willisornis vidua]|uniref:Uncharacterized protein n=1 Tax=Willisornis vidua TaxID=1566151 RepID=A0ABQ9D7T5_9PASS|nr:hypothetical protein WISP_71750 [Willisornis vidua]
MARLLSIVSIVLGTIIIVLYISLSVRAPLSTPIRVEVSVEEPRNAQDVAKLFPLGKERGEIRAGQGQSSLTCQQSWAGRRGLPEGLDKVRNISKCELKFQWPSVRS